MLEKVKLSSLTNEQKLLFKKRAQEQGISINQIPIEKQPENGSDFPLTLSQERLWFVCQLEPSSSMYNLFNAIRIKGQIDTGALEKSINILIQRHEILRTAILANNEGKLYQKVIHNLEIKLGITDLRSNTSIQHDKELHELLVQKTCMNFNFSEPPLFTVDIFLLNTEESIFLLNIHHIISDGWSIQLITDELFSIYNCQKHGEPVSLGNLPIQYKDYAHWQREWQTKDFLGKELLYWKNHLKGIPSCFTIPTDYPRPKTQSFNGEKHYQTIDRITLEALKLLSKEQGVSLYTTLLAVFKILLYRYTNTEDVVIGTPIAGRNRIETENIIGYFVNSIVLYTTLKDDLSFNETLKKVYKTVLDANNNQLFPFEQLLEELDVERNMSYSPLFQIFFIFQNRRDVALNSSKTLNWEPLYFSNHTSKFDLTVEVIEHADHLDISFEYNTDLYKKETIGQLGLHYKNMLQFIIRNADIKLAEIDFLTESEIAAIVDELNSTYVEYPTDVCIHQLIEKKAAEVPDETSVEFKNRQYTYRDLQEKSDCLCNMLLSKNIKPGSRIGVYLPSSPELIFALIGIFKAGCTYVPLDTAFPAKRLEYIADNANLALILTLEKDKTSFGEEIPFISINDEEEFWQTGPGYVNLPTYDSSNLAYIIYTSGSTGNPKGVMIPHRCVVNFLYGMHRLFPLDVTDSLLSVTTSSFDISVLEFFLPLITGARLILAENEAKYDGVLLREKLESCNPTYMQATPATWSMLLSAGWQGNDDLTILCGGEELKRDLAFNLLNKGKSLWNLYGPTETTIWSMFHQVSANDISIPIGKPIANTQVFILDKNRKIVPRGVVGDLYIAGDGVAPGYFNNDGLTKERFFTNPYSGKTFFYTGDKARINADNVVEFLGRDDHQLKVRGFRIEAAEIEIQINKHPDINRSVVIAKADNSGQNVLIAYIEPKQKAGLINMGELRSHVKNELPDYMVPSFFVAIDQLPLTPNGKIDRKQLINRPIDNLVAETPYVEPSGKAELALASIWQEVLNKKEIGAQDNFFSVGGHSIVAIQLITRINNEFDINLHLIELFLNPTIKELAEVIEKSINSSTEAIEKDKVLTQIEPNKTETYLPFKLTDVQTAYWMGRNSGVELGGVATHIYQEIDIKHLDLQKFQKALNKIVKRHPMLRAIFSQDGTQRILEKTDDYQIKAAELQNRTRDEIGQELGSIRETMSHQVLPGEKWPLFDIKASILPEHTTRLHISFDLLIGDAWSFQILLSEIAQVYRDENTMLEECDITFRDYVMALENLSESDHYNNAKNYWANRLSTLPQAPQLPLRINPEQIRNPHFKRFKATLPKDIWSKLTTVIRKNNVTKTSFLLACFSEVLSLWSRKSHFTLNLTLFNRLPIHKHINYVVGDFTTINLLEINLCNNDPFNEQIKNIQAQLWKDLDYRSYSGVRVTEDLIKNGFINEPFPVVFTSILDLEYSEQNEFDNIFQTTNYEETAENSISQTPQVWLDHQVSEKNGSLHFNWDVAEDLFQPEQIEEIFETYKDFLWSLANNESLWEHKSPLTSGINRFRYNSYVQKVTEFHSSYQPIPDSLLHHGFLQNAREYPDKEAVVTSKISLSYKHLDNCSNFVAAKLLDYKVNNNELVAVAIEKNWEQIASVIGILKSGAAYLPIDINNPKERLLQLLEIGKVNTVIVSSESPLSQELSKHYNVIEIQEEYCHKEYPPAEVKNVNTNLAYVIFTSGSTGIPKGVMIDHKGALNTIEDINSRFNVSRNDSVLGISALNFDLSVYDIFGILAAGGTLVLPDADKLRDPSHWLQLIKKHDITLWNSVPALMNMLTDYLSEEEKKSIQKLRLVMMSGDWIPLPLSEKIWNINKEIQVISLGGATEGSIWSIIYPISEVKSEWKSIPYGVSMVNQKIYVFNDRFNLCPPGIKGELYIGGEGVALGYWNDEVRTNERFIRNPHTGEMLFKTGDIGAYMPDGVIEFLGREDLQVKIGGYRIELGEIETVIKQHEAVREAVVNIEEKPNRYLAAYVIIKENGHENEHSLLVNHMQRTEFKLKDTAIRNDLYEKPVLLTNQADEEEYLRRRTFRHFGNQPIAFDDFSGFLSHLSRKKYDNLIFPKYLYGSAGGVYPVQTYIYLKPNAVENLSSGFYYYNPVANALTLIDNNAELPPSVHVKENLSIYDSSSFSIFLISELNSIAPLYGEENGKLYSYLEAGLISQLLEMKATKYNIGLCQVGSIKSDIVMSFLKLNPSHYYLHTLMGGFVDDSQFTADAIVQELQYYNDSKKTNTADDVLKDIKGFLQQKLPTYMVPNAISCISEIPITANGKVNRKALKRNLDMEEIIKTPSKEDNSFTKMEKDLADIWSKCLNTGTINKNDNFFDLGGNSFKIIEVHKALKTQLNIEIPIVELFKYPTLKKLADFLNELNNPSEEQEEAAIDMGLSRAQARLSRRR